MKIAILGANSQVAKDLIYAFLSDRNKQLSLFCRDQITVAEWLNHMSPSIEHAVMGYESFTLTSHFDVIINFVGAGDPGKIASMGRSIFDVTLKFDDLALSYIKIHPECRYIFISSGAVYGGDFQQFVSESSKAVFPINHINSQHWYGISKLHAEFRHRSMPEYSIVDIRIFNYFSRNQRLTGGLLMADIACALKSKKVLTTSGEDIVRDYLHPSDFCQIIQKILISGPINIAVDAFSADPINKMTLLEKMNVRFGLKFKIDEIFSSLDATGIKMNYFSKNYSASSFGYLPKYNSLEGITQEILAILEQPEYIKSEARNG